MGTQLGVMDVQQVAKLRVFGVVTLLGNLTLTAQDIASTVNLKHQKEKLVMMEIK